ncbi:hypothetical protein J3Q64DRAFT_1711323 [Phycomyces blakesleeanus]|uniref:GST N-terminal domain-containing protein n=2 Tax=Phycomyces blakesleeanus TaxID=4837 RepID=A0A167KRD5_PHYB8|nr:hypothetical protein PHYBLDRAFT_160106 [Phycomyces blakesleeanus NRRL 1555(-)]OAD68697.1 hypothetical protein PHYBLDRAFT_160106 [Phycomyces blakesleeanus NRRL 1555(-)]|eukprot:XP_018286737.1 hypothetical protein PHYBLDRAFT_160106 [Phycomyces blakesleeanus NRRL 1555(-)]
MKPIQFYDLALKGLGEVPWSPNTYKTRFTLNIKELSYVTTWLSIDEIHTVIPKVTNTGETPTVPVIVDTEKDQVIQDSFKIAKYLEATYPQTPSLFHGNEQLHTSMQETFDTRLLRHLFCLSVLAIYRNCGDESMQAEFRKNKEQKFGVTLEQFAGNPEDHIKEIGNILKDTKNTLTETLYLTGSKVGWADVVLASYLKMVDVLNHDVFESGILGSKEAEDSLRKWYERMSRYA